MRPHKKTLNRGPFTWSDVVAALKLDGWADEGPGGSHPIVMSHPTKPGKIPISKKWDSLKPSHEVYKQIKRTSGLENTEFLYLLNGHPPES